MDTEKFWQTKLAARLHDPAEKALILLRDPEGHENGTSRALSRLLGLIDLPTAKIDPDNAQVLSAVLFVLFKEGVPTPVYELVRRADWWAAGADRPQWPMIEVTRSTASGPVKTYATDSWAQVRWSPESSAHSPAFRRANRIERGPVGYRYPRHKASELRPFCRSDREAGWRLGGGIRSAQDFAGVVAVRSRVEGGCKDSGKLGELWKLLPADTRVPDHSIWDHLDLTSAFAGAFAADPNGEAALLAMSIGPVQSFIAAARKTEDLWAGSHLLSRLAWETMRPVCEELGPDAILFPRLRGIPQVDLWLMEMGLPAELFLDETWYKKPPDDNPLFAAALPNRFVAVVPASRVEELAQRCKDHVRNWLLERGYETADHLLEEAGFRQKDEPRDASKPPYSQIKEQLSGFPEVHWAVASFALAPPRNVAKQTDLDVSRLQEAMAPFFGVAPSEPAGFLASDAWKLLSKEVSLPGGIRFWSPNPGLLYPAIYDLTERILSAAKSVRPFEQSVQEGWRCTLTGETEWLTTDLAHLSVPKGSRKSRRDKGFREGEHVETLWTKIAGVRPAWAKEGEHLGALPAIKRLWPTLFSEEVREYTGKGAERFVVSTHTMALAHQLERLTKDKQIHLKLQEAMKQAKVEGAALPRKLIRQTDDESVREYLKAIPAYLDAMRESEEEQAYAEAVKLVREALASKESGAAAARLETYYALLMMDGDHMGAILSGEERTAISFLQSFHPMVRRGFEQLSASAPQLEKYGNQKRPVSPNRHLAISAALNDFSQIVVPHIVQEEHLGRLIYAGGDDVLAMLPVADVLSAMGRLRLAYSGGSREEDTIDWTTLRRGGELVCKNGFAYLDRRLMRMMGPAATASCGVVIAHHQTPLAAVLRELRESERRAKSYARDDGHGKTINRNAFHITVLKRSGGTLHLSAEWGEPLELLSHLRDFLAREEVSRRAVYNTLEWLTDLPEPGNDAQMLEALLAYQLARQAKGEAKALAPELARRLTALAMKQPSKPAPGNPTPRLNWLRNFLTVAEFLAREVRTGGEE
jgi:CRISPR-associated protein Cmr2